MGSQGRSDKLSQTQFSELKNKCNSIQEFAKPFVDKIPEYLYYEHYVDDLPEVE